VDAERAAKIQALASYLPFQELKTEIEALYLDYSTALARTMMTTGHPFDDFEYKRGYWAGLLAAVRYPDKAARTLERDLAKSRPKEEAA